MTDTNQLTQWLEEHFPDLRQAPAGMMKHPYLTLGAHYSSGGRTFLWDAFFEAVRLWHNQGEYADVIQGTVECYLDTVNPATGEGWRVIAPDGPLHLGSEQMQPFLCQFAYVANLLSPFKERHEEILERLTATLDYWQRERSTIYGLFRWLDSYESGIDMNPAVDICPPLTVVGVDLNVYLLLEYRALAELAQTWDKPEQAAGFMKEAESLAQNIREHLWNDSKGLFCNLDTRSGEFVEGFGEELSVFPWTNFTPLYAGIATAEQATEMIERYLLNPEAFRCRYGFRTFDQRSVFYTEQRVCIPAFIPHRPTQQTGSNWRGAVWVLSNYLLSHGLANYGYQQEALAVAQETVELCWQNIEESGGMYESFHPRTGKGLWAKGVMSWNTLADVMAMEIETGNFALKGIVQGKQA